MKDITEKIIDIMTWDHFLLYLILIILIAVICSLSGVILLATKGDLIVLLIGIIGILSLFAIIGTFEQENPNKLFTFYKKDNETIEIKGKTLISKPNNTFKIINHENNKITLKNVDTNDESKKIDKDEFFKTIEFEEIDKNKETENHGLLHKIEKPLNDMFGLNK